MRVRSLLAVASILLSAGSLQTQAAPRIVPKFPLDEPAPPPPPYDPAADPEAQTTPKACSQKWRCPDPLDLNQQSGRIASDTPPPGPRPKPKKPRPGQRTTVVGHGFEAQPGDAPFIVQIQRPRRSPWLTSRLLDWEDRHFCGGAWIAPNWIVTAAHCLKDGATDIKAAGYRVRLGAFNIGKGDSGISYRIVAMFQHPDYNPSRTGYFNDIALIRFAPDASTETGRRVWLEMIALDGPGPSLHNRSGEMASFFGWGRTERNRPSSPLLYGKMRIEPDAACRNSGIALCAKGIGQARSTQCPGDSGGPLVWWQGRRPVLIGIVSHNVEKTACGSQRRYSVFTRISGARGWIEGHTGPLPRL